MSHTAFNFRFQIQLAPVQQGVHPHAVDAHAGGQVGVGGGGGAVPDRGRRQELAGYGRAVQVEPMELEAPVTKRLQLNYFEMLSSSAFNFNLRGYTMENWYEYKVRRHALTACS
jgi:hypothetical protein